MKSPFKSTPLLVLHLIFCLTGCGYSGPRTRFTLEGDHVAFILSQSSSPENPQLQLVLKQMREGKNTLSTSGIHEFGEVVKERGLESTAQRWFDSASQDQTKDFDALLQELEAAWRKGMDQSAKVMANRLEQLGDLDAEVQIAPNYDRMSITVTNVGDHQAVRRLLGDFGELGFYETYGSSEICPILMDLTQTEDPDTVSGETLVLVVMQEPGLRELLHLESIKSENPAMEGSRETSEIGVVAIHDTAEVRQLLSALPKNHFPPGLHWAYSDVLEDPGQEASVHLYALRTLEGQPRIGGEAVQDAKAMKSDYGGMAIQVSMTGQGAEEWEDMTRDNVQRQIAIAYNGQVLCAPVVEDRIRGGSVIISGNFTVDQAESLAAVLKAGRLPIQFSVIEESVLGQ